MNVPTEIANKVIETMRATPFVLAIMILNISLLSLFAFTLHEVSSAMERREKILDRCLR
jgi:hypothetical protein